MTKTMILVCIFLFSLMFATSAQSVDILYLKNGSVIKGYVKEIIPTETVKIETADGSLFVYNMVDVDKISKEDAVKNERKLDSDQSIGSQTGFRSEFTTSFLGTDQTDVSLYELSFVIGARFAKEHIFLGGGVGVDMYRYNSDYSVGQDYYINNDGTNIPVFGVVKYNILNRKVSPFVELRTGYAFGDYDGFYVSSGVGCYFKVSPKIGLMASLNYICHDYDVIYDYYETTESINSLGIKIGIEF